MKDIRQWLGISSPSQAASVMADIERGRVERILAGAGFREYERPEGIRGTADLPEYRITDYWDGHAVDEGFTFSRDHAERSMTAALEQAYDVELHVRTDGDWSLVERREAED